MFMSRHWIQLTMQLMIHQSIKQCTHTHTHRERERERERERNYCQLYSIYKHFQSTSPGLNMHRPQKFKKTQKNNNFSFRVKFNII